jgi:N-acetylglutamate synthase/N-acetylornithine aminotransferase
MIFGDEKLATLRNFSYSQMLSAIAALMPQHLMLSLNESRTEFDEEEVRNLLSGDTVEIMVNLKIGSGGAIAYACDLTEGYIKENAAYYSS